MATKTAGKMPGYETTFIAKVELSDESLKAIQEKMKSIVESFGGEIVLTEDWGKRRLAYTIGKETRGHYIFFAYTAKPGVVAEIERNLRINENIIRFLTVHLTKEFDKEDFMKGKYEFNPALERQKDIPVDSWKRRTGPLYRPAEVQRPEGAGRY